MRSAICPSARRNDGTPGRARGEAGTVLNRVFYLMKDGPGRGGRRRSEGVGGIVPVTLAAQACRRLRSRPAPAARDAGSTGAARGATAFERDAFGIDLEAVFERERRERAGRDRERNVFDLAARAAAEMRVPRTCRFVRRSRGPRDDQLGHQTRVTKALQRTIDGGIADPGTPRERLRVDLRVREVAADPALDDDVVDELIVLRQVRLHGRRHVQPIISRRGRGALVAGGFAFGEAYRPRAENSWTRPL